MLSLTRKGRVTEFELIETYFRRGAHGPSVVLGNGDDAAVFRTDPGFETVISVDALIAGQHVPSICSPQGFAARLLGRGLSDLAAMAAEPQYVLLSLSLPVLQTNWIEQFAEKFHQLAVQWGLDLIGGDTAKGPLAAQVTVIGRVQSGRAISRVGAQPGDQLWLFGSDLGGARAYLEVLNGSCDGNLVWAERYWRPQPLVSQGLALSGRANALIDISDGLCQDLLHILRQSDGPLSVDLDSGAVPLAPGLIESFGEARALEMALTGGDDYCLLAAVPEGTDVPPDGVCLGHLHLADTSRITIDGLPLPPEWSLGWDHSR
jgi:thiamine-monophosphate kinase